MRDGVKLLGRGKEDLRWPLNVVVNRASKEAIAAIEAKGGSVMTRYYTEHSIRRILRGETDPIVSLQMQRVGMAASERQQLSIKKEAGEEEGEGGALLDASEVRFAKRLPDPANRKDIEYYRDPAHRGYLSYQVEQGQGPSLFFKAPVEGEELRKKTSKAKAKASENRMW